MAGVGGVGSVLIYQDLASTSFTAPLPTLNTLMVGPCYWIMDYPLNKSTIGTGVYGTLNSPATSTGAPATLPVAIDLTDAPNDKAGAEVNQASTFLYMDDAYVSLLNSTTDPTPVVAIPNFITGIAHSGAGPTQSGVLPGDRLVLTDNTHTPLTLGLTVQNTVLDFTDSAATFNSSAVNVQPGDVLTITIQSANSNAVGIYNVLAVVSATELYITQATANAINTAISSGNTTYNVASTNGTVKVTRAAVSTVAMADDALELTSNITTSGLDINGNAYSGISLSDTFYGRVERELHNQLVGGVNGTVLSMTTGNNAITINAPQVIAVTLPGHNSTTNLTVNNANTYIAYTSLRTDLAFLQNLTGEAAIVGALGEIDERNPLAVAAFVASQNTSSAVQVYGVTGDNLNGVSDLLEAHEAAISALGGNPTIYAIVPLTQELSVIQAWLANCVALAQPTSSIFRIVIGSSALITTTVISPTSAPASTLTAQAAPGSLITVFTDSAAAFVTDGVAAGNVVDVTLSTASSLEGTYTVAQVISNTELVVLTSTPLPSAATFTTVSYTIAAAATPISYTGHTVVTRAFYNQLLDNTASFMTQGVIVGDLVQVLSANSGNATIEGTFPVIQVNSNNVLTVSSTTGTELSVNPTQTYYRVLRNLTTDGQVAALNAITGSPGGLFNSRCTMIWPDTVLVSNVTNTLTGLQDVQPSYYVAAAVGGMIAGLPSQQGFSFLPIAGIQQVFHSTGYFSQTQLNTLSQGGWFVCVQNNPASTVYVMREMTTDTTSLETGELQQVKNFDYISIFFKGILQGFLGVYNVLPETIDFLAAAFNAGAQELENNYVAKIGAPLLTADLVSIAPLVGEADRIEMYATITMPVPLNYIGLHLTA